MVLSLQYALQVLDRAEGKRGVISFYLNRQLLEFFDGSGDLTTEGAQALYAQRRGEMYADKPLKQGKKRCKARGTKPSKRRRRSGAASAGGR